ncbi:MAG: 16S rRNA (adenine(1518)-N(6)/adenine(1519)-N(6))-dimethyltransferase RsmA [Candidatus Hadarchaeota archaeon]
MSEVPIELERSGIRLSKREGQHMVVDPALLERMVEYGEISKDDTVLEIGAGLGSLTELLARRAGKVIAVEKDARLYRLAKARLSEMRNVELLLGDVLKIQIPEFNKVVANIPYSISSELTFKLLERPFKLAVLMYQKEFARRLVAKAGLDDYGRLTVNVYRKANVELLEEVPPESFFPQPEVTSTIVRLEPRPSPFNVQDDALFSRLVRGLFQHRRQRVRNAILHSFEEIFPGRRMSKEGRRGFIDATIPKKFADAHVAILPPESFGEISNLLSGGVEKIFKGK